MILGRNTYKIGIDIGGTNTDIVLIDSEGTIVAEAKTATTLDINEGIKNALMHVLKEGNILPEQISGIFFGTTQIANAIHQQNDLYKVGVVRVAGQRPEAFPSCYLWPEALRKSLYIDTVTVDGGFECHGEPITPVNPAQIKTAVKELLNQGIESLAVVGAFASLNPRHEILVKEIAHDLTKGELPVSLSHQIGGAGFLERENSTILNAALKGVMTQAFKSLTQTCATFGLAAPIWITQNNGSIVDLAHAIDYPVLTISAGLTNSCIGGMKLGKVEDAIIIDIGGTSTDVGVIRKGIPRRCLNNSMIGGVKLNFPMPDVYSIGMGGGSHVQVERNSITIGPKSSGSRTFSESVSFGGSQTTLTDIALALGYIDIPGARPENVDLSLRGCRAVINEGVGKIYELIAKIGPEVCSLPIVMIGGGATLFPKKLLDERFIIPPYARVANAYGAALAEISATIDTVVSLEERQIVLDGLREQSIQAAIQKGADFKTVKVVDIQILPYHYVPNRLARVIVRASGSQPAL
jgi:N-methylhydantoinase A/oxoprolinase/acetone carboxylase beta subunit